MKVFKIAPTMGFLSGCKKDHLEWTTPLISHIESLSRRGDEKVYPKRSERNKLTVDTLDNGERGGPLLASCSIGGCKVAVLLIRDVWDMFLFATVCA